MKLLKDYDYTIEYQLGKANIIDDTLSRKAKSTTTVAQLKIISLKEMLELKKMNLKLGIKCDGALIATMKIRHKLVDQI